MIRKEAVCARRGMKYKSHITISAPLYAFKRISDGDLIICTRYELRDKFGLSLKYSRDMIKGIRDSRGGFSFYGDVVNGEVVPKLCLGRRERKTKRHPSKSRSNLNVPLRWVRIADGIVLEKSRIEMRDDFGIDLATTGELIRRNRKALKGFCLEEVFTSGEAIKVYAERGGAHYRFKNTTTGEAFVCTVAELANKVGAHHKTIQRLAVGTIKLSFNHVCLGKEETPEEVS